MSGYSSKRYRECFKALNNRLDFLNERIAKRGNSESNGYDRQEAAALYWAINVIQAYPDKALIVLKTQEPYSPEGSKEQ